MKKNNGTNPLSLGLVVALAACGGAEPNTERRPDGGNLAFELTFDQGVEIGTVDAVCFIADASVPGGRASILEKTITVSGISSDAFEALWGQLTVSDSWVCEITSVSTDGRLICSGQTRVRVRTGETTEAPVDVQCVDSTPRGNILVNGEFNTCPDINDFEIFPLATVAGQSLQVQGSASDLDGDGIAFRWSVAPANRGTFSGPDAPRGLFTCDTVGTATITLTVDDGRGCGFQPGDAVAESQSFGIECLPAGVCGDGNINAGEACEAPFGPTEECTGPADPRGPCIFKFCGDGVLDDQLTDTDRQATPPRVTEA